MAEQQKTVIRIPKGYDESVRHLIGRAIVNRIIVRTRDENLDKNNRRLGGYDKDYSDGLDFKIAGKSRSDVDLTLTGEMLNSLDVIDSTDGEITIGYKAGDPINGKVKGNRLGTYGQNKKVGPKRDFLGITNGDLGKILKKFPNQNESSLKRQENLNRINNIKNLAKLLPSLMALGLSRGEDESE
jgi:hypothetical protein